MAARKPRPDYVIAALWPLVVPIDSLVLDPTNAMTHPEENVEAVMGSLSKFKQRKPVVVNVTDNVIEAGNCTWKAAKALGWEYIAAVFVEDDAATATGYAIADNRTSQLAEWDFETLKALVETNTEEPTEVPGINADFWKRVNDVVAEKNRGPLDGMIPDEERYQEQYGVIVLCEDEPNQEEVYNTLREMGYNCKVVVT